MFKLFDDSKPSIDRFGMTTMYMPRLSENVVETTTDYEEEIERRSIEGTAGGDIEQSWLAGGG